ncbi:MAG: HAD hydrolase family protein, partial [Oscillospiraceae bacterium]|nr:HAD hydrolase family protein [Oscillospiraceae bacterium]
MQRYLLAFDLDGTACNDSGGLGKKTKQAFAAAQADGHVICFATGRRDIDMVSLGTDYKCADYLLLNNGGKLVRTADDAVLFNRCIEKSVCEKLVRHCLQNDYVLHIVSGMYWRVNRWTQGLTEYVNALGAAPKLYHTAEELCLNAVEGMMATEHMEQVCAYIDAQKLPLLHVQSEPGCTDIMCADTT